MNHDPASPLGRAHSEPCVLEATGLTASLGGRTVLEVPSLHIAPNEVLVVIGPNGSGKTTLVLCLALLLKPETGEIRYRGLPVNQGSAALALRRRFAVVFQDPLLLDASVWDNVTLGMRLRGFKKAEMKAGALKWLERFGIASLARRQARALSGGEAKRVSLARAFALQPEVLFLDEPFTSLDIPTRQALLEDFEKVLRETRVTTLMVTHDRNEAVMLANRVAVMMNGRIRQVGSAQEVFSYPADEEVAAFVGAGNILRGMIGAQSGGLATVDLAGKRLYAVSNLAEGTSVALFIQHEDITISLPAERGPASSARNHLTGKIVKTTALDSQIRVTVDCGFPLTAVITRRSWEDMGLGAGREVVAWFKASAVHLIESSQ